MTSKAVEKKYKWNVAAKAYFFLSPLIVVVIGINNWAEIDTLIDVNPKSLSAFTLTNITFSLAFLMMFPVLLLICNLVMLSDGPSALIPKFLKKEMKIK